MCIWFSSFFLEIVLFIINHLAGFVIALVYNYEINKLDSCFVALCFTLPLLQLQTELDSAQPYYHYAVTSRRDRLCTFVPYLELNFLVTDLNNSYLEEQETSRPPSADEMDFDTLLKLSQKSVKSRKASCKGR